LAPTWRLFAHSFFCVLAALGVFVGLPNRSNSVQVQSSIRLGAPLSKKCYVYEIVFIHMTDIVSRCQDGTTNIPKYYLVALGVLWEALGTLLGRLCTLLGRFWAAHGCCSHILGHPAWGRSRAPTMGCWRVLGRQGAVQGTPRGAQGGSILAGGGPGDNKALMHERAHAYPGSNVFRTAGNLASQQM